MPGLPRRNIAVHLRRVARRWARAPWTVALSVVSIALGITAVTVVFAGIDATLLRPIPGTHAPELVRIEGAGGREPVPVMSYPEFLAIEASGAFRAAAAERVNGTTVVVDGVPRAVGLAAVSPEYFATLGVRFILGGAFEDIGGEPAVVVSEAFWKSSLGSDRSALGRTVYIRGRAYRVAGVVGDGFEGAFPVFRVALWAPLSQVGLVLPEDGDPSVLDDRFLNVLARSPAIPGASLDERLDAVARGLRDAYPFPEGRTFRMVSARGTHPSLKPIAGGVLTLMLVVAGMVLLVACANVANLLLAQGVARRSELAVRMSLGAGRGRLVRSELGESALLGLTGSVVGLGASALVLRALSGVQPPVDVPLGLRLSMDPRVAAFAAGLGVLSGVVFGLWPALRSTRRAPADDLSAGVGELGGVASWPQRALVVVQVLATTVLLVAAGLMVRGLDGIDGLDPGFRRDGVVTVEADLSGWEPERVRAWWARARQAAVGVPGVEGAALGLFVHLGGRSDQRRVGPAGSPREQWAFEPVNYSRIEGGLLELLGIPMEEGRTLAAVGDGPPEVVVNRVLADALWPGGSALGRALAVEDPDGNVLVAEVVGVTPTVRYRRLNESPTPFFYLQLGDDTRGASVLHVPITGGEEDDAVRLLRTRLAGIAGPVPLTVRRMTDHTTVAEILARMIRTLLLFTGAAATLIALAGVFGLVTYLSARRRPEFALRLALGATPAGVRRMVVWDLGRFVLVGVAGGLILGRVAAGRLGGLLFAVGPGDFFTYLSVPVFVLTVAVAAAWVPAFRVTLDDRRLTATLRE